MINLWLPFVLPWIPILIWLRPRLRYLYFKKENGAFGVQFLATLAILAPTIIAQKYLAKSPTLICRYADNQWQYHRFSRVHWH